MKKLSPEKIATIAAILGGAFGFVAGISGAAATVFFQEVGWLGSGVFVIIVGVVFRAQLTKLKEDLK